MKTRSVHVNGKFKIPDISNFIVVNGTRGCRGCLLKNRFPDVHDALRTLWNDGARAHACARYVGMCIEAMHKQGMPQTDIDFMRQITRHVIGGHFTGKHEGTVQHETTDR